jgi:hypothetical protein
MRCDPFWRILRQPNCFRKIRRSSRPVMMPPVAAICPVRWTLCPAIKLSVSSRTPCRAQGPKASRRVRQNFRTMHRFEICGEPTSLGLEEKKGKRDRSGLGRFRERQEVPVGILHAEFPVTPLAYLGPPCRGRVVLDLFVRATTLSGHRGTAGSHRPAPLRTTSARPIQEDSADLEPHPLVPLDRARDVVALKDR